MNANLALSRGKPVHFRTENYRSLTLGVPKGKNDRETTEKQLKTANNRAKRTG